MLTPVSLELNIPDHVESTEVGVMARIPRNIWKRIQQSTGLPKLATRKLQEMGVDHPALLTRNLPKFENNPLFFDGPTGVGKSIALLQMVSLMLQAKIPVLYIPELIRWTDGYYAYYPASDGSTTYEQPELAIEVLDQYRRLNELSSNSTVDNPSKALHELMHNPNVMLVVDQVNAVYKDTMYKDTKSESIPIKQMRTLSALRNAFETRPCIMATSFGSPRLKDTNTTQSIPKPTRLQPISENEAKVLLNYYAQLNIIHPFYPVDTVHSEQYVKKKLYLSDGIMGELWKACQFEHLYYKPSRPYRKAK